MSDGNVGWISWRVSSPPCGQTSIAALDRNRCRRTPAGYRLAMPVLGVDRKRSYRWRRDHGEFGRRAAHDELLAASIAQIHGESAGAYRAARITAALRRQGLVVNLKREARIMRERGTQGVSRRRRRPLTRPDGKAPPAPAPQPRPVPAPEPGHRAAVD